MGSNSTRCCPSSPNPEEAVEIEANQMRTLAQESSPSASLKVSPGDEIEVSLADEGGEAINSRYCSCGTQHHSQVQPQSLREFSFEFPWTDLELCTCSFARERLLSSGHASDMYRGMLEEGTQVAVKVIKTLVVEDFEKEVRLLSRCRHPNVVTLMGFSIDTLTEASTGAAANVTMSQSQRVALVYEFLPGGSAFDRLHSSSKPYLWKERLKTAAEATRGLSHLHRHRPEIFHRDIKTSNIIFASDGTAKLADFSLACVSTNPDASSSSVTVASGTPGYRDPEYATTNIVSEGSEVYSMGMVLIEFLTGRPPFMRDAGGFTTKFLLDEVNLQYDDADDERLLTMIDIAAQWQRRTAKELGALAVSCIHPNAQTRPSFRNLAILLQAMATSGGHWKPICSTPRQVYAR